MKKLFSFAMVLMVLVIALGFNVGSASAAPASIRVPPTPQLLPPRLILYSPYFEGLNMGEQVPAQMFADSNYKGLYCLATGNPGYVACDFPRKYAGKSATLYLQAGGETLIFWVTIPNEREEVLQYF